MSTAGAANDPATVGADDEMTYEREDNYRRMYDAAREGDLNGVISACEQDNGVVHMEESGGRRALHIAAWGNHLDMVRYLLGRGADVHAKESQYTDGRYPVTALDIAERERYDELATLLRTEVNAQMSNEHTKQFKDLLGAITNNDLDKVRALTKGKDRCDPVLKGTTDDGFTLLHHAGVGGNVAIVKHLLDTGAFIGPVLRYGWNEDDPLDLAQTAKPEVVPELQKAFDMFKSDGAFRYRILERAARIGNLARVRAMVECDDERQSPLVPRSTTQAGPFHLSVQNGHLDVVQYLAGKGAPVHDKVMINDTWGPRYSALDLAQQLGKNKKKMIAIVEEALAAPPSDERPDPRVMTTRSQNDNYAALLDAISANDLAAVQAVIGREPDVAQMRDEKGYCALHQAAWNGNLAIVKELLVAGAYRMVLREFEIPVQYDADVIKKLPVDVAASNGHQDVVDLLNTAIDEQITDDVDFRYKALGIAAERGGLGEVKRIVEMDPTLVTRQDDHEMTPFIRAVSGGQTEVVAYLLSKGADVKQWVHAGPDSIHAAINHARPNSEIARMLRQAIEIADQQ